MEQSVEHPASRERVIAGNWKMYKTREEAVAYVKALAPLVGSALAKVYLAVPYTLIHSAAEAAKGSTLVIGAQNMNDASEGAFTGEIAAKMLLDVGAQFVILGHSERRQRFNEDNGFIHRKIRRALQDGLQPILCIGETLEERESNKTEAILAEQLTGCLGDLTSGELAPLILAYEPVWAIGTNRTATPEIAQKAHQFCRSYLSEKWGTAFAEALVIQYGGSVKPENAAELMSQPDIDGLLVGGASLDVETFNRIIHF